MSEIELPGAGDRMTNETVHHDHAAVTARLTGER